nr:GNAT family N-acetyltransferase [Planococcus ruber]
MPEDAEKLIDLMKHVEQSGLMLFEPGERNTHPEHFSKRIEALGEDSAIFLAEDASGLIGYLFAMGEGVKRKRHSASIALGIAEEHRGKGIGTELFAALESWARKKGLRRIELTVMETNAAGQALYKKAGFEVEGTKRDSLIVNGQFVNEYYMAKIIG